MSSSTDIGLGRSGLWERGVGGDASHMFGGCGARGSPPGSSSSYHFPFPFLGFPLPLSLPLDLPLPLSLPSLVLPFPC